MKRKTYKATFNGLECKVTEKQFEKLDCNELLALVNKKGLGLGFDYNFLQGLVRVNKTAVINCHKKGERNKTINFTPMW